MLPNSRIKLYIFWFLHQTTTRRVQYNTCCRCISFDSYIKPQHFLHRVCKVCVVYLLIPTSNHNLGILKTDFLKLYIFWFLHQTTTARFLLVMQTMLYIFWFLHQTTTGISSTGSVSGCISFDSYIKPQPIVAITDEKKLYIFWFLHQTTTESAAEDKDITLYIFWFLHQTTTYTCFSKERDRLYIFWFLHQTTTFILSFRYIPSCISFDSYIKPQQTRGF